MALTRQASRAEDDTSLASRIDALFAQWNSTKTPGYAVGVIRDGKLIFARGYGMANLEYGAPITSRSPFYIGSMSKQFTAACAALLVQRGKLRLTDEVRKYIPELPDYGHPLTVEHLIHHTGGVREWSSLMLFAGQDPRFEQHIDKKDVLRLLLRQKSLEFTPGSQFRYSSGGYVLLAEVIERVTGQSLRTFARENLFEPLGMHNTFFDDNYAAILPGRVESYRRVDANHYERLLKHFDLYGDGGVITTVEDLVCWDANFYNNRIGDKDFIDLLLTRGRLNSGEDIPYAFGLEFRHYKGHPDIEHNGFMIQFTADMVRFPEQHLSIIVLGNIADRFATEMAYQIADVCLKVPAATAPSPVAHPTIVRLAPEQRNRYLGNYWNREGNFYRRVVLKDAELILDWGEGTGGPRLIPAGEGEFRLADDASTPVSFVADERGGMHMTVGKAGRNGAFVADRYDPTPPASLQELKPLAGEYYSAELKAAYIFTLSQDKFTLTIGDNKPRELFPNHDSQVIWNARHMLWIGIGEIIFQRDRNGKVTGFTIGDQRVSAIHFTRTR